MQQNIIVRYSCKVESNYESVYRRSFTFEQAKYLSCFFIKTTAKMLFALRKTCKDRQIENRFQTL